jgi:peptidoglycan/LPS O-acetylase OafA/YrhL
VAYRFYDERFRNDDPLLHDLTLLLGAGFACWLILFGLWGLFARWLRNPNRVVAYVADASFWIYLIHLPALLLVENALARTDLPAGLRLGAAVAGALAFSLLTYAIFVRRTPIGRFLRGGKRLDPRGAAGPQPAPATASG